MLGLDTAIIFWILYITKYIVWLKVTYLQSEMSQSSVFKLISMVREALVTSVT